MPTAVSDIELTEHALWLGGPRQGEPRLQYVRLGQHMIEGVATVTEAPMPDIDEFTEMDLPVAIEKTTEGRTVVFRMARAGQISVELAFADEVPMTLDCAQAVSHAHRRLCERAGTDLMLWLTDVCQPSIRNLRDLGFYAWSGNILLREVADDPRYTHLYRQVVCGQASEGPI